METSFPNSIITKYIYYIFFHNVNSSFHFFYLSYIYIIYYFFKKIK